MFLKKNKISAKVLSKVKEVEFDEVISKIQELFRQNGKTASVDTIRECGDWVFVDDGERIVVAVSIGKLGDFSSDRVYILSSSVSLDYKKTNLSLEEHRKAICDVFKKAVEFAENSKEIDYLVQVVNHFDVRASVRAGFNADLLQNPKRREVVQTLIDIVRYIDSGVGLLDYLEDQENYKVDCLRKLGNQATRIDDNIYGKGRKGKTNARLLRVLRKNRKFIEVNPAEMAYCGLILGVKTK